MGLLRIPSQNLKPQSPADQLAFKVKTGDNSEAEGTLACWERHSSIVSGFGVREGALVLCKKQKNMDFPGSPVVETALPMPGAQVRSLIRELRSDTSQDMALKEIAKKEKKFNFTR